MQFLLSQSELTSSVGFHPQPRTPGLGAFGKPASGLNNRGGPEQGAAFCLRVREECRRSLRPSFRRMLVATGRLTRTKVERPA